jgi:hypothetical protein
MPRLDGIGSLREGFRPRKRPTSGRTDIGLPELGTRRGEFKQFSLRKSEIDAIRVFSRRILSASREIAGRREGERNFFIWIGRNPLKSPDSDE